MRTGPKPVQRPWPPLWVGGNSDASLRRAVRLGDGWHVIDLAPEELALRAGALRQSLDAGDRERQGFTLSLRKGIFVHDDVSSPARALYGPPDKIRADRDAYAKAGLDYLVLTLRGARSIDSLEEGLVAAACALQH